MNFLLINEDLKEKKWIFFTKTDDLVKNDFLY